MGHLHRVKAPPRAREGAGPQGNSAPCPVPPAPSAQGTLGFLKQRRSRISWSPWVGLSWGVVGTRRESRGGGHGGPGGHPVTCQLLCKPARPSHSHKCAGITAVSVALLVAGGSGHRLLSPPAVPGPFLPCLSHLCLGLELDPGVSSGRGQAPTSGSIPHKVPVPGGFQSKLLRQEE